jgi:hypothetical protein
MLKILKATDPLPNRQLVVSLYSLPGYGKTTLGFTASKPLLFNFDHGIERAAIRKDAVDVNSWEDVSRVTQSDLVPYDTVLLDTVDRALSGYLAPYLIKQNPKLATRAGGLTLPGWGDLKSTFAAWLNLMKSYGKDIVFLSHLEEQRVGDDVLERLDIAGGTRSEVYKQSDLMGRITMNARSERLIDFSPRLFSLGKNPPQFDVIPFPDPRNGGANTLAQIIDLTKKHFFYMGERQKKAEADTQMWSDHLENLKSLTDFNAAFPLFRDQAPPAFKDKFKKKANELGFKFSKGAYVDARQA